MRRFTIIGKRGDVIAAIHIETAAEWIPLSVGDRTDEFIPDTILQVDASDDNGSRAMQVQTTRSDGIDIHPRLEK